MKKIDKWAITLLIIAVFGMLFLPHIVTQTSWFNYFGINYGDPNEIGDMIGGILGPFLSFISAILIYLTLREQISMNDEFKTRFEMEDQLKVDNFHYSEFKENTNLIKKRIEEFSYLDIHGQDHIGKEAVNELKVMISNLLSEDYDLESILGDNFNHWKSCFINSINGVRE